ncbi:hypothetical protein D3C86_2114570 [compost metagenome]
MGSPSGKLLRDRIEIFNPSIGVSGNDSLTDRLESDTKSLVWLKKQSSLLGLGRDVLHDRNG